MIVPTTSIAFIILGIGSWVFCFMFRRAFRKGGGSLVDPKIRSLIGLYYTGFAILSGIIVGIGTIIFGGSPFGLFYILIIFTIGLTILGMLGIYSIAYIFFPKDRPIIVAGYGVSGLQKAAYIARDLLQQWDRK